VVATKIITTATPPLHQSQSTSMAVPDQKYAISMMESDFEKKTLF